MAVLAAHRASNRAGHVWRARLWRRVGADEEALSPLPSASHREAGSGRAAAPSNARPLIPPPYANFLTSLCCDHVGEGGQAGYAAGGMHVRGRGVGRVSMSRGRGSCATVEVRLEEAVVGGVAARRVQRLGEGGGGERRGWREGRDDRLFRYARMGLRMDTAQIRCWSESS